MPMKSLVTACFSLKLIVYEYAIIVDFSMLCSHKPMLTKHVSMYTLFLAARPVCIPLMDWQAVSLYFPFQGIKS